MLFLAEIGQGFSRWCGAGFETWRKSIFRFLERWQGACELVWLISRNSLTLPSFICGKRSLSLNLCICQDSATRSSFNWRRSSEEMRAARCQERESEVWAHAEGVHNLDCFMHLYTSGFREDKK